MSSSPAREISVIEMVAAIEASNPTSAESPCDCMPENIELPLSPTTPSQEIDSDSDYQVYYGLASLPGIPFFYNNDTAESFGYSVFPPHPITLNSDYRLYYELGCLPGLNLLHKETQSPQSDVPTATLFPSRPSPSLQVYQAYQPSLSTESLALPPPRPDPTPLQRPQTQQHENLVPLSDEEPQTQESEESVILIEEEIPAVLRPGSIYNLASLSRTSLVRPLSVTIKRPASRTEHTPVTLEDAPMPNDSLEDVSAPSDSPDSDPRHAKTGFLASIAGSFYKRRDSKKRAKVTRFFTSIAASFHGSREKSRLVKVARRLSKNK